MDAFEEVVKVEDIAAARRSAEGAPARDCASAGARAGLGPRRHTTKARRHEGHRRTAQADGDADNEQNDRHRPQAPIPQTSMKGPSLSRHTSAERARTAYDRPFACDQRRVPGPTFHHRMPGHLTFSFSHLCELARELSVSLDQDGRHSPIDHRVVMPRSTDPPWRGRHPSPTTAETRRRTTAARARRAPSARLCESRAAGPSARASVRLAPGSRPRSTPTATTANRGE